MYFRHVEAQQFHAKAICKLFRDLGFPHTGRTGEEVVADGFLRLAQACTGQLDRGTERLDGLVLTENNAFQRVFEIFQHLGIVFGDVLRRNACDFGHHRFDLFRGDRFAAFAFSHEMLRGARFVDHVDRLVGQFAVVDIARGKFHSGFDRIGRVADVVVLFEIGFETLKDFHRIIDRRFVDVDFLETTRQRAVFFEMLAEFLIGRGAHAAQFAALKRRLQKVGGIHRAAGGGACADHSVNLVDEQDGVRVIFELFDDRFQAFLKVATIAGARQKGAHVEREDGGFGQNLRRFAVDDFFGETFGDGGFAHARIAHQKRVVLAAAAEHLDAALDLMGAADQRIDIALGGLFVEIDTVFRECRLFVFARGLRLRALGLFLMFVGTGDRALFAKGRVFRHTMRDEIHRIIARHILFLQEIGGVGFAFGKDRDQHVGSGHLGAARGLDMDRGALDHALERGGGHGLGAFDIGDERRKIVLDIIQKGFSQLLKLDIAGLHHAGRVGLVDQGQQQVFQGCKFVAAGIGQRQGCMDGLLKGVRK